MYRTAFRFVLLRNRAASSAFKSSGLKIAGSAARLTVPSGVMASLPTLRVSGTCFARTTIFNCFFHLYYFK